MDDKILTHKQKVNVLGVRILRNIERGAEIFPGVFAKDIERRVCLIESGKKTASKAFASFNHKWNKG